MEKHEQLLWNLQQRVAYNEQAITNRFLALAIQDISNDKPTLSFLDPADTQAVIKSILEENNITVSNTAEQLPIVEVITKLIIRQQVDFIPAERYTNNSDIEIGKLTFTTYYAIPSEEESDFDIYKIITGPFIHHNKVVRLAQMPAYIGINQKKKSSITWSNDDLATCTFHLITTCRQTPAEKFSEYGNPCLEQALSGNKLRNCRSEHTGTNLPYIQQLQNGQWFISTNNTPLHCIRTLTQDKSSGSTIVWSENAQVIIPPVAIVTVPNGTTIHCPEFNLPGPVIPDARSTINIIRNLSTIVENNEIIDMYKELNSNETWQKLPYLNGDIDALVQDMLSQTTQANNNNNIMPWHNQHSGKIMICLFVIIIILIIGIIWFILYVTRAINTNVTIALPNVVR